jgi:TRAP-type C4-dicarboxylate transport system substrate-binding protein
MWDGFWQLANGKAWKALPPDVQAAISKNFAAAALAQREDMAKLNISVEKELRDKGLQFNEVDPALFRAKLQKAGFFTEWKGKYGDEAWAILEKYTGKIA